MKKISWPIVRHKFMTKYIIPIAVISAFISGALLNSGSKQAEKELEALRKKERVMFQQQIIKKQVEIQGMVEAQREIREKMCADSLKFSEALNANKRAYLALKKKYNEINLNRATVHELDSIITALYH